MCYYMFELFYNFAIYKTIFFLTIVFENYHVYLLYQLLLVKNHVFLLKFFQPIVLYLSLE
jgi:hypothetical protein